MTTSETTTTGYLQTLYFSATPESVVASENRAVAVGTYRGVNAATGKPMQARFAHVWELRDGRAMRFEQITDTASWTAAMT